MKKLLVITIMTAMTALPFTALQADEMSADISARVASSKAAIKSYFGSLKSELQTGMKQGGPVNAIKVCQKVSPLISHVKSVEAGMRVARTSLKLRNPDSKPDAWEQAVLEEFEARKAKGDDVKKMVKFEVTESDGKKQFRFMKAIPTGKVCLKCHGTNLAEPVAAKLKELYPQDQATGFKLGDIRGAFTITQDM